MKIGQLVKTYIPNIIDYCQSKYPHELEKLQDKTYSKQTFGISFPFLVRADGKEIDQDSVRYWKKVYRIGDKDYRFCSQWYKPQRNVFLDYLKQLNLIDNFKYLELKEHAKETKKQPQKTFAKARSFHTEDKLANEALEMSIHYKKFYYLERSLRAFIEEVMSKNYGDNWWDGIDERVKRNVDNNLDYELDTTHTKRSYKKIDYTTFGDLRKIINQNWSAFESSFTRNRNSVNEVLIDLNRIRVSIAHCTPLAKKEVTRFGLRLDDWKDILS